MAKSIVRFNCGHEGCGEFARYEAYDQRDRTRLHQSYGNGKYRCVRHDQPDRVLSAENRVKTYECETYDLPHGRYWTNDSGFIFGPGFKGFASDFPVGTKLRVTAEIVLPESTEERPRMTAALERLLVDFFDANGFEVGADRVVKEFDGNLGGNVQFDMLLELDQNDKIRRVLNVFDVDLVDLDFTDGVTRSIQRLDEIKTLPEGWLDGGGKKLDGSAFQNARSFIGRWPLLTETFRIFPTPAGGVQFEFEYAGWDYTVEFTNVSIEAFGVEISGQGELEPVSYMALEGDFSVWMNSILERRG